MRYYLYFIKMQAICMPCKVSLDYLLMSLIMLSAAMFAIISNKKSSHIYMYNGNF